MYENGCGCAAFEQSAFPRSAAREDLIPRIHKKRKPGK
jgi:hypothetical protein